MCFASRKASKRLPLARAAAISAIVTAGLAVSARAGHVEKPPARTLEAVGTASVRTPPDRARVVVTVASTGQSAKAATEKNEAATAALANRLKNLVRGNGAVTQRALGVRQDERHDPAGGDVADRHFTATAAVEIVTSATRRVGKLVDVATSNGASEIRRVEFFLEDDAPARSLAVREAGQRAREKAVVMAESLGVELGPLLHASSEDMGSEPRHAGRESVRTTSGAEMTRPLDLEVTATVRAVFEIH